MDAIKNIKSGAKLLPVVENKTRIITNVFLVVRAALQTGAAGMEFYANYDSKSPAATLAKNKALLVEQVDKLRAALDEIGNPTEEDVESFKADLNKLLGFYRLRSGDDAKLPDEFGAFQNRLDQAKRHARERVIDEHEFELRTDKVAASIVNTKVADKAAAQLLAQPKPQSAASSARAQQREEVLAKAEKVRFATQTEAAQAKAKKDQELLSGLSDQTKSAEIKQKEQLAQQATHNKAASSRSRNRMAASKAASMPSTLRKATMQDGVPE